MLSIASGVSAPRSLGVIRRAAFASTRFGLRNTSTGKSPASTKFVSQAMPDSYDFDLVTLGAGSGGVRASRFASQLYNAKCCVVELPFGFISSETVGGAGGTCVVRGCVPKKLLVYASQFASEFADGKGFGWNVGASTHSWSELISHKSKEVTRLSSLYGSILKNAKCESVEGRGRVIDPHTVEVQMTDGTTRRITAKNILVAVGGYAVRPNIEGAELAITSDEALSLDSVPSGPVAIIGAGYIACEFAGIFSGLGSKVELVVRGDKVLRSFDEECRDQVQSNLKGRGVNVSTGASPTRITRGGAHGLILHLKQADGTERQVECGLVMFATGRRPRTQNLGLAECGVAMDSEGAIKVDQYSRSTVPSIWAVGDVTGRINLTPVALMEGMAFASTCFGDKPTKPDYNFVPCAVFCSPPLASVGFTEEAAIAELSGDLDIYVSSFRPMKNTLSGRDEKSLMKLIVHAESGRVVGAHIVGPDAPEIMQGLAIALKAGATKEMFDSTVGIHPTAAEELVTMRTKTRTVRGTGTSKL